MLPATVWRAWPPPHPPPRALVRPAAAGGFPFRDPRGGGRRAAAEWCGLHPARMRRSVVSAGAGFLGSAGVPPRPPTCSPFSAALCGRLLRLLVSYVARRERAFFVTPQACRSLARTRLTVPASPLLSHALPPFLPPSVRARGGLQAHQLPQGRPRRHHHEQGRHPHPHLPRLQQGRHRPARGPYHALRDQGEGRGEEAAAAQTGGGGGHGRAHIPADPLEEERDPRWVSLSPARARGRRRRAAASHSFGAFRAPPAAEGMT